MMTNLLKDMLPDAPREANVLITAAGAGVPTALQGYLAQGMDVGTATQLAAGTLAERTALTADACAWATSSLATALLPLAVPPQASVPAGTAPRGTAPLPGSDHPTMAPYAQGPGPVAYGPGAVAYGSGAVADGPAATLAAGRDRAAGVSLLAAAFAAAGALATILACAFSIVHFYNSDGTYASSESLFSLSSHGAAWNWIGLVVAAALSVVAALLLVASRTPWVRAGAAGVVGAFGIAVIFIFAAYQFTLGPVSDGNGPAGAEKLGGFGGLLLLVAGVLGFVAAARGDRAVAPAARGPARRSLRRARRRRRHSLRAVIYHIATAPDWALAQRDGQYTTSTRDRTLAEEGFIHASTAGQVAPVANAYYRGVPDLVVLVIDPGRVGPEIRYELVPGSDAPYPHIYGPLNTDAVVGTRPLDPGPDGEFTFTA